jgi:hypothetical protein
MKTLSADIETKILNDMDERMREITQIGVEQTELIKVILSQQIILHQKYHMLIIFYTHLHMYSICGKEEY